MLNKCDADGLRQTAAARPLRTATAVAPRRGRQSAGARRYFNLEIIFFRLNKRLSSSTRFRLAGRLGAGAPV